jgi:hypothetical protein
MKYRANWTIQGLGPKTLEEGDIVDLTAEQVASLNGSAAVTKIAEPKKEAAADKAPRSDATPKV